MTVLALPKVAEILYVKFHFKTLLLTKNQEITRKCLNVAIYDSIIEKLSYLIFFHEIEVINDFFRNGQKNVPLKLNVPNI